MLADIVQHAVETSRPLITERNQHLNLDLPSEPVRLFADRTRLRARCCPTSSTTLPNTPTPAAASPVCEQVGEEGS